MRKACLKYGFMFTRLALSAGALMHVSQQVQSIERDIAETDRAIEQEQERIRVLKAEWAYLNDPARLEALAQGAYGLDKPAMSSLISTPDSIPESTPPAEPGMLSSSIPISFGQTSGGPE